jgi:hypothetical protein
MKKTTKSKFVILAIFVIASIILTACGNREPEIDIEAQKTGFAQTAAVQASMTAEALSSLQRLSLRLRLR